MTGEKKSDETSGPIVVDEPREGITRITLNRPERLNAMTSELIEGLHRALDAVAADRSCRVVILTGAGRGFCAGLDLRGYGDPPGTDGLGDTQKGFAVQTTIARLIPHLRSLPQPVIAAVNGPATGGGFALVLGCDVRIAARTARFNAAFIRIGLSACDIGTSWLLPRLVGAARARSSCSPDACSTPRKRRASASSSRRPRRRIARHVLRQSRRDHAQHPFGVALTRRACGRRSRSGHAGGDRPGEPSADHGERHRRPSRRCGPSSRSATGLHRP